MEVKRWRSLIDPLVGQIDMTICIHFQKDVLISSKLLMAFGGFGMAAAVAEVSVRWRRRYVYVHKTKDMISKVISIDRLSTVLMNSIKFG